MDILQAILLGLLQGITEFLPVSSSGHLVLGRALFASNLEPGITFEIVVHFGSFCSIVVYFRKVIWEILSDLFKSFSPSGLRSKRFLTDSNTRLSYIILISMIPAGIVGITMKDYVEDLFLNPLFVSCMLLITGVLLFSTKFITNTDKDVDVQRGILIGVAQSLAILPGISRAGATISVSLFSGMSRSKAANFSFLMVLPVLAGAMLLELVEISETGIQTTEVISLAAGFLTSFVSGYFALKYLIILLKREMFHHFAWYCWTVGIIGIFYFS